MPKSLKENNIVCVHDFLHTLGEVIASADEKQRKTLDAAIGGYAKSYPEDFIWAFGAQSPMLLQHLMMTIDIACQPTAKVKPKSKTKARRNIDLADSKPMGNA